MADTQNALPKRNVWFALLLPLVAIVALSLLLTALLNRVLETARWVEHTEKVIAQAFRVEKLAIDMETGLRGFQLSRDAAYLEPFEKASRIIDVELDQLKTLVRDNPQQEQRAAHIQRVWKNWNQFASDVLERAKAIETVNAPNLAHGKALMDDTRREIAWFVEQEELLREARHKELLGIERNVGLYRTVLLSVACFGVGLYVVRHFLTRGGTARPGTASETPPV
jgi:methyl-accepting chemotaxis protein